MIELVTKDYGGFASACLDLCVPKRAGRPGGLFDRRVEVFLGDKHVNLMHQEWGITLHGWFVLSNVRSVGMLGAALAHLRWAW